MGEDDIEGPVAGPPLGRREQVVAQSRSRVRLPLISLVCVWLATRRTG
ncbi:hypothetical protein OG418_06595 [Streptomyces phaeochromogenes]|nr:hypothetical protein [Streptomyces phaeochromogenes]MCX5599345.1 hypothetical protein [Streptomyces phaeochromogenes]WSJ03172.1 hypothetical protein OG437_05665 [Streptomyces phaeochromogenes]